MDPVERYFESVVIGYNCGDVQTLLDTRLDACGPLLISTMNGIDLLGGMMRGFNGKYEARSTAFMIKHLGLSSKQAHLMWRLVRCGVSHQGATSPAVWLIACYDRVNPGTFLYKLSPITSPPFSPMEILPPVVVLDVTELARRYLEAVDLISRDVLQHLHHVPGSNESDKRAFDGALSLIADDFNNDFLNKLPPDYPKLTCSQDQRSLLLNECTEKRSGNPIELFSIHPKESR
jgi:hypothetical protein